jgi:DNA-binding response OmpR family regulator
MSLDSAYVSYGSARLLVADDDPILREFASVHLATPEVELEVAEDGVMAWDMLRQGGFDIALVDLEMPRMDGFELIGHIRSHDTLKHLPIVVVTGREDMAAVDRAYALGATSFVVKPLNWRVLSHQLAYVLRNAREAAEVRQQLHMLQGMNEASAELLRLCGTNLSGPANAILRSTEKLKGEVADEFRQYAHDLRALQDHIGQASKLLAEG